MSSATILKDAKSGIRGVEAELNYIRPPASKPRYHANDWTRDTSERDTRKVFVEDGRSWPTPPTIEGEGLQLVRHVSKVRDFHDPEDVARHYPAEIEKLLLDLTGADCVGMANLGQGAGGSLVRYTERSPRYGRGRVSGPARLIHIDPSEATAKYLTQDALPKHIDRPIRRACNFNIWRAVSEPPQDKPLAVCAANSFSQKDLHPADAVFDAGPQPWGTVESLLMSYNPDARWVYFPSMTRDEALVFKANDSDLSKTHNVPHTSFDDPSCPPNFPGRESIEIRGCAYWFA